MNKAKMNVIRFNDTDVIATSYSNAGLMGHLDNNILTSVTLTPGINGSSGTLTTNSQGTSGQLQYLDNSSGEYVDVNKIVFMNSDGTTKYNYYDVVNNLLSSGSAPGISLDSTYIGQFVKNADGSYTYQIWNSSHYNQ